MDELIVNIGYVAIIKIVLIMLYDLHRKRFILKSCRIFKLDVIKGNQ